MNCVQLFFHAVKGIEKSQAEDRWSLPLSFPLQPNTHTLFFIKQKRIGGGSRYLSIPHFIHRDRKMLLMFYAKEASGKGSEKNKHHLKKLC
jgi:hypothetical protein